MFGGSILLVPSMATGLQPLETLLLYPSGQMPWLQPDREQAALRPLAPHLQNYPFFPASLSKFRYPGGISCWQLLIMLLVDLPIYALLRARSQGRPGKIPFLSPHFSWSAISLTEPFRGGELLTSSSPGWTAPSPSMDYLNSWLLPVPLDTLFLPMGVFVATYAVAAPHNFWLSVQAPNTLTSSRATSFFNLVGKIWVYTYSISSTKRQDSYRPTHLFTLRLTYSSQQAKLDTYSY